MADDRFVRQFATIVSVDAVGFSRMMGTNADATVEIFEARSRIIRDVCAAYGGTSFGAAGDSVMADFSVPASALMAAIEFQDGIAQLNARSPPQQRLDFRVGINTGNVIVRNDNRYGDNVNIAARLQEIAPAGGIVVSGSTHAFVHTMSLARFTPIGEHTFKNIAYPVAAWSVQPGRRSGLSVPPIAEQPRPADAPPAIAVLPLRGGGDGAIEAMGQGVSEDVIAGVSGMRWLPVVAKGSSFLFPHSVPPRAAGHAMNARYVVSGEIERRGNNVGILVKLDDVRHDRTIWSGAFEQSLDDMLRAEHRIGVDLVAALADEVDRAEQMRTFTLPAETLDGWQLVRRGRWHMAQRTSEDLELARTLFEDALARDPTSTAAMNELAWWHFWRAWRHFGGGVDVSENMLRVVGHAQDVLSHDPEDARAHYHLGIHAIMQADPSRALGHLDEALRLNPSHAHAHSSVGSARLLLGDAANALPAMLTAERLSPFDLYRFHNLGEIACSHVLLEEWNQAADAARRSLALAPAYWYAGVLRLVALWRSGRHAEAAFARRVFEARHPDFDPRRIDRIPFANKSHNASIAADFARAMTP